MDNVCRDRRRRKTCHPRDDFKLNNKKRGMVGGDTLNDDCQQDHSMPLPDAIPNVTIAEFGSIEAGNIHAIQAEIYAR